MRENRQEPALKDRADAENARLAAGTCEARAVSKESLENDAEDICRDEMRLAAVVSWRRVRAADILEGRREFF
jgi:hypothetical protein